MGFAPYPSSAAWRFDSDVRGFEVLRIEPLAGGGALATGQVSAMADRPTGTRYEIEIGADGGTRRASISELTGDAAIAIAIVGDGAGQWMVNGEARPDLDGCFDVDLEASAFTNALPVRRLDLPVGGDADAPAVYVESGGLTVSRLEQRYLRLPDDSQGPNWGRIESRYAYSAPRFAFSSEITYDESGLVVKYPWIGSRVDLYHEYPEPPTAEDLPCCEQLRAVIGGDKTALAYDAATRTVEILTRPDAGSTVQAIRRCPFCGSKLPRDLSRARWKRLKAAGLVGDEGIFEALERARRERPEFLTSAWWKAELERDPNAFRGKKNKPKGDGRRAK